MSCATAAHAETQGEAIVAAAASHAGVTYCWAGGNEHGPSHGDGDWNGEAPDCTNPATVGFDCTGLTQYAAYQGTGGAVDLTHHDSEQAKYAPGTWITSESALEPGDIVYFGASRDDIEHAAIYAGVVNGQQMLWDANTAFWIYPDGVHERSLASENSLGFVGAARVWSGNSNSAPAEGAFASHDGYVYRIAGGAPVYVSSWSAVGGPQPSTPLSDAEFAALPQYPRDGTILDSSGGGVFVVAGGAPLYVSNWAAIGGPKTGIGVDQAAIDNAGNGVPWDHLRAYPLDGTQLDASGGGVFIVAGGAPLYLSSWSAIGGPKPGVVVDEWDIQNTSNPAAHLRPYPADGTQLDSSGGGVFIVAGGAPLYLSNWAAIGGPKPGVAMDQWDIDNTSNPAAHLRPYPADGTQLDSSGGGVFIVAGGAPLYLSNWTAIGGPKPGVGVDEWDIQNTSNPAAHLRPYPTDGTFLSTSTGQAYRIAGGAPFAVSNWSLFGGTQPSVEIDTWDIENTSNPAAHLRASPADGTVVEGLPSDSYWQFASGYRSPTAPISTAVTVDDFGLAAFPQPPLPSQASSHETTSQRTRSAPAHGSGSPSHPRVGEPRGRKAGPACVVPVLIGITPQQAAHVLRRAHCRLGRVRRARSASQRGRPHVIRQSRRPHTYCRSDSRVSVTLS